MLLVSLDCLCPVSCVTNVTSVFGLSLSYVLCDQCYQCLWIVFVLCLVWPMLRVSGVFVLCPLWPMLPVSLDCLCPVSCVTNVTSISGLSLSCILCDQCYQCLWIIFVLCPVWPMLPVSLDCLCSVSCVWSHKTQDKDNPETLVTLVTQDTGQRQSRDTGNIGHTRHRTKTIQRH
jgi:hypothetical protein